MAEHADPRPRPPGPRWQSAPGASLTFSLALPLAPADWSGLSLAVGVALADALDPPAGDAPPRIGLKWPNDLWLLDAPGRGRKLGGILIETVAVGERRMAVIGVGLNVLPQPLPQELAHGYACLQELWPEIDAPQALQRVAAPLVRALQQLRARGLGALRRRLRAARPAARPAGQHHAGRACPKAWPRRRRPGRAARARGRGVHALVSGEVSVRPAA